MGRRERERENPSNPTARFVPAIFSFFFKKKTSLQVMETEEGPRGGGGGGYNGRRKLYVCMWGPGSLLFRVCRRLLAKPEKSRRLLAPPLRSMKIKCRRFLLVYERRRPLLLCLGFFGIKGESMDEFLANRLSGFSFGERFFLFSIVHRYRIVLDVNSKGIFWCKYVTRS